MLVELGAEFPVFGASRAVASGMKNEKFMKPSNEIFSVWMQKKNAP